MIFGIVSFDKSLSSCYDIKSEFEKCILDYNNCIFDRIERDNAIICRIHHSGIYEYSGILYDESGIISIIVGEPIMSDQGIVQDHVMLCDALNNNEFEIIANCRGVFCNIRYIEGKSPVIEFCSDKLGIRPLYYWTNNNIIVFSTQLKFIENLSFIPKIPNFIARSQIFALGYAIGGITKYLDIQLISEARIERFSIDGKETYAYWHWDSIKEKKLSVSQITREAYELFLNSIKLRIHDSEVALAFLSGGMDSRAIVAALFDLEIKAELFNYSPEGSQDQVFAQQFAELIDYPLNVFVRDRKMPKGFRRHLADSVKKMINEKNVNFSRPNVIWSGDGGSVCLGCVYLDDEIVNTTRSGDELKAIQLFLKKNKFYLPLKVFKNKEKSIFNNLIQNSIIEELMRFNCKDKGQSFFLFLVLNDQRRHLHDFYEDRDIHKLEYQLPLFDSKFLEFIFSLPLDSRLYHRFYHDWFYRFPSQVHQVPWQTYPDHLRCPLVIGNELKYQWDESTSLCLIDSFKSNLCENFEGLKIIFSKNSIGPVSKIKFFIVIILNLFKFRNYNYIINACKIYVNYFNKEK